MDILLKEIKIEGLKMVNECTLIADLCSLNTSNVLMESETASVNPIRKIIESIKKFFKNMVTKIKTLFGSNLSSNAEKVSGIVLKSDIKNEKIEIRNWKKVEELRNNTKEKIKKAKSEDEVNKVMDFYRNNKKKILASSVVALAVSAALVLISNKKTDDIIKINKEAESTLDQLQKTFEVNEEGAVVLKKATALSELYNDAAYDWTGEVSDLTRSIKDKTGADCSSILSKEDLKTLAEKMMGSGIK